MMIRKHLLYSYLLLLIAVSSCKTKAMTSTDNETQPMSENQNTLTHGLVSHHYQGGSCSPVLIVKFNDSGDSTILWPKDGLPKEFDKDGLWLKFNYLPLRMPSPEACPGVQPVSLSDIQKK